METIRTEIVYYKFLDGNDFVRHMHRFMPFSNPLQTNNVHVGVIKAIHNVLAKTYRDVRITLNGYGQINHILGDGILITKNEVFAIIRKYDKPLTVTIDTKQ